MKRVVYDEVSRVASKGTCCTEGEDRTRQEDRQAADINVIMKKFDAGVIPFGPERVPYYADVSQMGSLHESLERVRKARESFDALPAEVRSEFQNDVARFVDAFSSEEGIAKLRELKVVAETDDTLADRREAAADARAEKRREARELAKRLEAARHPPVPDK